MREDTRQDKEAPRRCALSLHDWRNQRGMSENNQWVDGNGQWGYWTVMESSSKHVLWLLTSVSPSKTIR
jgi:hypothetical protein